MKRPRTREVFKSKVFFRGGKHAFDQEKGKMQEKRKKTRLWSRKKKLDSRKKKKGKENTTKKESKKTKSRKIFYKFHLSFLSLIDCQQFL